MTQRLQIGIRIVKYAVNIAGLIWMLFGAYLSYGLIVRLPDCNQVLQRILNNLKTLIVLYLLFVTIITVINYSIERKFEKQTTSREFFWLMIVHGVLLTIGAFIFSYDFYCHCGETS